MKFYQITDYEKLGIEQRIVELYDKQGISFEAHPEWWGKDPDVPNLKNIWHKLAVWQALFEQAKKDGLASIEKLPDSYYSFKDHEGDCFNPEVNPDIDPAQLKRDRAKEQRRFHRQGAFYHTLWVAGEYLDGISGFVGDDFYGSGYDDEFYRTAVEKINELHPDYFKEVLASCKIDLT